MIINCVAYQDGRKLADVPVDDIEHWLRRPGCFVWVALRDATREELAAARRAGFRPCSLGPTVLRAENAALACVVATFALAGRGR